VQGGVKKNRKAVAWVSSREKGLVPDAAIGPAREKKVASENWASKEEGRETAKNVQIPRVVSGNVACRDKNKRQGRREIGGRNKCYQKRVNSKTCFVW